MITETDYGDCIFRYESEMGLGEKLRLMATLFEGMGCDYKELKMMLLPPSNDAEGLWESGSIWGSMCYTEEEILDSYRHNINTKIKDIVAQKKLSFEAVEKMLIGTQLENYAHILFITLASINEESYHPKVRYQYKSPSEEQRKLIKKMIDIYPYTDKATFKSHQRSFIHQDEPNNLKEFEITLNGYMVRVKNYERQKAAFEMLADEYLRLGLNQCFPYGESEPPDIEHPFQITKKNLEEQKKGKQGGTNERNFIRDLAYRIHYLMHINEWFGEIIPFEFDDICSGLEESLLQYKFTKDEAELIAQLLFYFGIYDGQRKGKGITRNKRTKPTDYIQNLYMLIRTGEPKIDIIDQIEQLHPSYIRAMNKFYEKEYGGE